METIYVDGIEVEVYEGYVSINSLCQAMSIGAGRQKEKCAKKYGVKRMLLPLVLNGERRMRMQVGIKRDDAKDFINSRGLWVVGPYHK